MNTKCKILLIAVLSPGISAAIAGPVEDAVTESKLYTDTQLSKKLLENKIETVGLLQTLSQNTADDIAAAKSEAEKYTDQKLRTVGSDIGNAKTAAILEGIKYTNTKADELNDTIADAKTDAVSDSNGYTDTKITEVNTAITDAKTDAMKTSKDYTDSKVSGISTTIDNAKTEAVTTSNTYTDNKVSNIHSAIDDSRKQAVSSGQQYTNARFTELETSMNGRFNSVEQQMNKNADRANAGIASVAAMANIPYTDNTRFSMGLGAGNYRNGNAVAFGGQLRMENNVNLRTSVSWNSEDSAVYGAGVAFGF